VYAFEKAAPLKPIYDDFARLWIVRAHLREVAHGAESGSVAKARTSFAAFEDAGSTSKPLSERAHSMRTS
jgi:hypothetical protein